MIHFDLRLLEPLATKLSRFKHVHQAACGATKAKTFGWRLDDVTCKKCFKAAKAKLDLAAFTLELKVLCQKYNVACPDANLHTVRCPICGVPMSKNGKSTTKCPGCDWKP